MFKAFYNHVNNIIATALLGWYYPALVNESPQRLIKLICSFIRSQFHGVCSNIYFITFLFFFFLSRMYNLQTFWSLLQTELKQEINIWAVKEKLYIPLLYLKLWQTYYCSLKTADDVCWTNLWIILRDTFHFCTKKGQVALPDITWQRKHITYNFRAEKRTAQFSAHSH